MDQHPQNIAVSRKAPPPEAPKALVATAVVIMLALGAAWTAVDRSERKAARAADAAAGERSALVGESPYAPPAADDGAPKKTRAANAPPAAPSAPALPAGFPTGFPVAAPSVLVSAASRGDGGGATAWDARWKTSLSAPAADAFYRNALSARGWTVTADDTVADGSMLAFERSSDGVRDAGTIAIGPDGDGAAIGLSLTLGAR